ncbi:unnamed protein product, partial [Ectocarpus fasciculatus]
GGSQDEAVRLHTACMFSLVRRCMHTMDLTAVVLPHTNTDCLTLLQQRAAQVSNNHVLVYRVLVW